MPPIKDQHIALLLDLHQDMGLLRGQVELLVRDHGEAVEARKEMASRLSKVDERLAGLDIVAEHVKEMRPIVTDYEKLRQNINGGVIVLGGIGAALFTIIGFAMHDLWTYAKSHLIWS